MSISILRRVWPPKAKQSHYRLEPVSDQGDPCSKGLKQRTPAGATCFTLRVTTMRSCTNAVAATRASTSDNGSGIPVRPQRSATARSTSGIRSRNWCRMRSDHYPKAKALFGSRRRTRSTPWRNSPNVRTLRKSSCGCCLRNQSRERGSRLLREGRAISCDPGMAGSRQLGDVIWRSAHGYHLLRGWRPAARTEGAFVSGNAFARVFPVSGNGSIAARPSMDQQSRRRYCGTRPCFASRWRYRDRPRLRRERRPEHGRPAAHRVGVFLP